MNPVPSSGPAPATRLVLASASPRRRRLLAWLDVPFEVEAVDTPENLDTPLASDPAALAISLAAEKAEAALAEGHAHDAVVLTFDTIVVLDGAVLGKPADVADAWRMLRALSGRTHQVVTGCAMLCAGESEPRTFAVTTNVSMKPLTDCQIEAWMAMGTFLGCAGAYNIEAQIAEVTAEECFQNVAGLPLCHVFLQLRDAACTGGVVPSSPVGACDSALCRHCELATTLGTR